jgi:hypothetical protein
MAVVLRSVSTRRQALVVHAGASIGLVREGKGQANVGQEDEILPLA